ncbi:glycosyltransferase [Cerasicoccus arenae]|uniref:glycosyltransferase n=1 Tax=Cerasicoccus arenae TaxID=424488 RepID=UPI001677F2EE|nr:glycosyltransferase [Cerasicoccus arenae]MBK1857693.1 glycosyltransferase [Cerasicoccus arenae]
MKVSVITPCYNAARFLPDCVASVRHALAGREYEHIVADGGSTDATLDFLRSQPDVDWRSGRDQGMYDALNQAAARATGEVIIHLNTDEQLNRVGVNAALDLLERDQLDAVLGPTVMVNGRGVFLQLFKQVITPRLIDAYWHMPVQTCSFIYRRALWERYPYDASYRLIADHLWVRRQLELGAKLGVVREPIGIFAWHGDNLSSTEGKTSTEDARAGVTIPRAQLQRAKRIYRLRKLLAGGYWASPVSYEIIRNGKLEQSQITRPRLKIRGNPRDLTG